MDERSERMARRFEVPILVAALLVIPVIVIEESSVGQPWRGIATALNWVFTFEGLRYAALLALMTLVGGGTAFASVEKEPTAWDGIWWAITTMTTVGYGDVPVTTNAGRVIAIIVMVVGIGFGTLVIGAISERFVAPSVEREVEEAEQEAVEEVQDLEAEVLRELRAMSGRLQQLETALQRRGS